MRRLDCAIQNYAWGKSGSESFVARFVKDTLEEDSHYAELWMGTHQNGPSSLLGEYATLKEYIQQNPELLGFHEEGDLKFLFKVLSVGNSLSIQSHPTKEQAKALHEEDAENYPDRNHKPEMAIALTNFELLCGFQKPHGIVSNIKAHKELLELVDEKALDELTHSDSEEKRKEALKNIFTRVWNSSVEDIQRVVQEIVSRLFLGAEEDRAPVEEIVLRLNEHFPLDVGVLAPFFLNHFTLKPGEAVFLGPNEPHAYLLGDCIECMALSDNTIRAGLTTKYKDLKTFCQNLTYKMMDPPLFPSTELSEGIIEYAPPVEEFTVHKIKGIISNLPSVGAGSILIVMDGQATLDCKGDKSEHLARGDVLFLPKTGDYEMSNVNDEFLAFRAFCPVPK